ncbi:hypothetical protein C2845_PM11G04630 [Panicum miliaceum]|uniref:Uncharacterized protein n=1 Tax=Panicum miliaceum TaxID=4540 RepID=A0A3L6RQE6_PANMI|nr:hypothetical protein C2845_PM11G04630 [Panicum miliaceum]
MVQVSLGASAPQRRMPQDQRGRNPRGAPSLPEVCASSPPRKNDPPSPPPLLPPLSPKPFGDPYRRPRSDLCVVPRSLEIDVAEARLLSCTLVAVVGGARPVISPQQVGMLLEEFFLVQHREYTVHHFDPEDFLLEFASAMVVDRILHAYHPDDAYLEEMHRQSMASLASLCFRVLVEFRGIPAHARNLSTAMIILDTSCSDLCRSTC